VVIATAQLMVVLDATIVNVALPYIQRALGFSGSGLEWVVNAYTLAFGGLLLLGGRAGDLLGRRKVFIAGLLLFSAASLAGGFATSQAWLLAARAVQGAGAAVTAATALALIATTFPEGPPRNRAMGVYAAMSVAGGAVGLLAGGLLTTYASWRWVLFVNVPIGLAAALAASRVLSKWDAGAWGHPRTVAASTDLRLLIIRLLRATPLVSSGRRSGGAADRTLRRAGCAQGIGHRDGAGAGRTGRTPDRDQDVSGHHRGVDVAGGLAGQLRGHAGRDGVDRGLLEAGGAPRGSTYPGGGERTPPAACRSRPLKLGAA
jgi:MFS family permease